MSRCVGLVPGGGPLTPKQSEKFEREMALTGQVCKVCQVWREISLFRFYKRHLKHSPTCADCVNARDRARHQQRVCPLIRNIHLEKRRKYHAGFVLQVHLAINEGLTLTELTERFGIVQPTMSTLIARFKLPKPGRKPPRRPHDPDLARLRGIHRLAKAGLKQREIAAKLGLSVGSVASYIARYGLRRLPWPLPEGRTYHMLSPADRTPRSVAGRSRVSLPFARLHPSSRRERICEESGA